jgi:hypothetical protein
VYFSRFGKLFEEKSGNPDCDPEKITSLTIDSSTTRTTKTGEESCKLALARQGDQMSLRKKWSKI